MSYPIKRTVMQSILLSLVLITSVYAAPLHEECDGEKKTCCLVQDMSNVPPMWVNAESCPSGMIDDANCPLQYGCTAENAATKAE